MEHAEPHLEEHAVEQRVEQLDGSVGLTARPALPFGPLMEVGSPKHMGCVWSAKYCIECLYGTPYLE